MIKNKKAQYYGMPEPEPPYSGLSPIFIIGIVIMVLPYLSPVVGYNLPGFIVYVGLLITLIGGAISIYNKSGA